MKVILRATAALALTAAAVPLGAAPLASDPAAMRSTITTLVGFGTRHTLSTTTDPVRGIGAARRWARGRLDAIGKDCGGCLAVETVGDTFTGARAPAGVRVEDVFAVQKGTSDPGRVVIVQGHIDSRISDSANATGDAPGANDDASGVAVVVEAARLLSKEKFAATIVYAVLSGEEQGLWGGQLLARTAKARGWKVAGVLNNDIVGNTHGIGGEHVDDTVRVFSEGLSAAADLDAAKAMRAIGAEDDSPSRSLAKAIARVAAAHPGSLRVFAVRRSDRFGRGGDQLPFMEAGYPAVRITEATENYDRQHQDIRVENGRKYGDVIDGVDFPYLAKVAALNVATLRELATAPAAPATATIAGAVSDDTTVNWAASPGASGYRIRWRRADGFAWTEAKDVPAATTSLVLPHVNIDDHFFGVAALSASGAESLVTFAGPVPRPAPGSAR
ncbi:M20/M25/M40 family metallo-hydrolase [Polymorphobacter sp. PAMC 29334]|uniref:M28 family peptidase n=1 Tax=Polymorphobacter sp. PAMC 29334 TaxID=2862331 RepID=UPI001C75D267|nr:M28 family peptidase [Polymorphobacter sp. PAMC 29334]QYE33873.1 M20/M25/M40 family metallo-hydrolase [Polymorphobacter sp. PAMC 29334]